MPKLCFNLVFISLPFSVPSMMTGKLSKKAKPEIMALSSE